MTEFLEKPIQIIVNGRAVLTVMTHAAESRSLVYGLLYTERVVDSMDNIDSVVEEDTQVSIVTKHPYSILLSRKTVLAGCGGASSFLDSGKLGSIEHTFEVPEKLLKTCAAAVPSSAWVSAGLFARDGTLLHLAEDLTAQNAADILIGYALQNGIRLEDTFVLLRGNCTAETMRKLIIAKIPVLAVAGEITGAAAKVAGETGLSVCRI